MKLTYIMDPYCSWCYAFSKHLSALRKKYTKQIEFELLCGGLWIDDNVRYPSKELNKYILSGNQRISKLTDTFFSEKLEKNILSNSLIALNSEPPSRAIAVFQLYKPDFLFEFTSDIQNAFYAEGKNLNSEKIYAQMAGKYELNPQDFQEWYSSEEVKSKVQENFETVRKFGITSYPALLLDDNDGIFPIMEGYESLTEIDLTIREFLNP